MCETDSNQETFGQNQLQLYRDPLQHEPRTYSYPMLIVYKMVEGNEFAREFHVTLEISPNGQFHLHRPFEYVLNERQRIGIGIKGYLIAKDLFELPGVVEIKIDSYSVTVILGKAFNWEGEYGRMTDICTVLANTIYREPLEKVFITLPQMISNKRILGNKACSSATPPDRLG